MIIKELKEMLNNYNDDDIVIMAKDSEGNYYSPLSNIWEGKYVANSTWSGEVYIRELTPELIKEGYTEEDLCGDEDGENAIILCPVN